jgi:hypothetical protein
MKRRRRYHLRGGWVGSEVGLDVVEKGEILYIGGKSGANCPSVRTSVRQEAKSLNWLS